MERNLECGLLAAHNLAVLSDLPQSFSTSVPNAAFPPVKIPQKQRRIIDSFIKNKQDYDTHILFVVQVHDEFHLYSGQTGGQILLNISIRSRQQFQREMREVFKSVRLHNVKV